MKNGQGQVVEIFLDSRVRLVCPSGLIPAPGQYLLAHAFGTDDPLADSVFFSDSASNGFVAAPGLSWMPGTQLSLRGPLGHGFNIPVAARKIALVAFDDSPERLRGLIPFAFKQGAEVVLVSDVHVDNLPEDVEVQPLKALSEICQWSDFAAFDVAREKLPELKKRLEAGNQLGIQVLIRAPMPCGAVAECGVCAVNIHNEWKLICKDGPVFEF
jgi:NAD(P)H-flavin reductase